MKLVFKTDAPFFRYVRAILSTDRWVAHLFSDNPAALFYPLDVRSSASSQFQLLNALCRTSQEAVSDGLLSFAASDLVTPTMLSRSTFDMQVELLATDSRTNLLAEQRRTSLLTGVINEQNQLPTALGTNFLYVATDDNRQGLYFVQ